MADPRTNIWTAEEALHAERVDKILDDLVRDGSLVLCSDGRYRCTEHGAQQAAEWEAAYAPELGDI